MRPNMWMKPALAMGTAVATAMVLAQPASGAGAGPGPGTMPGAGSGPGMMRGYDEGSGRGDCYGRGDGSGMMRGYGGGPDAWGGPGMMRGYGGGPRMMRGYGGGPGAALEELGLSTEQEQKIAAIREDMRRKTWDTMGALRGEQFKLRSLYRADQPDPSAIAGQQKKVDDLRLTMIKAHVEAGNQMRAVLTNEQRERLREIAPWWLDDDGHD